MLDLTDEQLEEVRRILRSQLPVESQVYAFGSRAKMTARPFSDLDLLIRELEHPISYNTISLLQHAFSESDLPFMVDLVEEKKISEEFKAAISPQLIQIS